MNMTLGDEYNSRPLCLADFIAHVHELNAKWWLDPATGLPIERNKGQMRMLMISEVAEAMEGERKGLKDDKLPHRPMAEVEIADVVIRLADYAGGFKYKLRDIYMQRIDDLSIIGRLPQARHFNDIWQEFTPKSDKGEVLEQLCVSIMKIGQPGTFGTADSYLSVLLFNCEYYCQLFGYDLWGAVWEKLEYNKTRADHKAEARLRADGKKW